MISSVFISLLYVIFGYLLLSGISEDKSKPTKKKSMLFVMLAAGLAIRYIGAAIYPGNETDMQCFVSWSELMFKTGPSGFYSSDVFTDYPPVYMYVLWLIGAIKSVIPMTDKIFYILLKTPAIICDVLIAALLFKTANRKIGSKSAYFACAAWLFNPAVFIDSALWGQVDSVFTLLVFVTLLLVTEKRFISSFFIFGIAVMLKPQSLFYAPIILLAVAEETVYPVFKPKELVRYLIFGLLAILFAFAVCVPFGITNVINQYIGTLSSYNYGSVNAYNLWSMVGLNWVELSPIMSVFGNLMIIAVVIAAVAFFFHMQSESKYFWLGGFICFGVFTLSVKMHERYAFPAMLLLLVGFISDRKSRQKMWLYIAVSVTQIINVGHILFYMTDGKNISNIEYTAVYVFGALTVGVLVWLIYTTVKMCSFKPVYHSETEKNFGITRKDITAIAVLTAVYAAIALFNLGDMSAPKTAVTLENETRVFSLNENDGISGMKLYIGQYHIDKNNTLKIELNNASGENVYESEMLSANVFCWNEYEFNVGSADELVLSTSGKVRIIELALLDNSGNIIGGDGEIFDEQEFVPTVRTFNNSTYFDEIYHARTAYEFIAGDSVYEWTHPPLGKVIISIGIKLFGMNPFGWRIMGTLFGIFMVPAMYILAKKLFGRTYLALFAAVLFTFDFMHFTQTRIATIDVYITFFVILMYMFMISYLREDFYGNVKKLFLPLGLCGISFGLGIASKWTGFYAGAGLAVIFFANLFAHYGEYRRGEPQAAIFPKRVKTLILFCVGMFVIIPAAIYMLSYIPFLKTEGVGIAGIWKNQMDMFGYHSNLADVHDFSSPWYQWAIMYRPVWYYTSKLGENIKGTISAFGNPLVWWVGIPAFVYTIYAAAAKKDKTAAFLSISYLAQLLPWVLVSRITYIYHYFPCVPFVVLMLGYSAEKLLGDSKKTKAVMLVYAVLAIALFAMFYPVLSGYPINEEYLNYLSWFKSWVF